jgi:hypothetical protein
MGPNESLVDRSPVYHATVRLGNITTHTDQAGVATLRPRHSGMLKVSAGDTLKSAALRLEIPRKPKLPTGGFAGQLG